MEHDQLVEVLEKFLEWMDGRGLVVTEPESSIRLEIEEWLSTPGGDGEALVLAALE